jgi:hypothetical protein
MTKWRTTILATLEMWWVRLRSVLSKNTFMSSLLLAILGDDGAVWFYIRMNALRALAELCRIIPKAAFSLVEPKTFAALRNINKKCNKQLLIICYFWKVFYINHH